MDQGIFTDEYFMRAALNEAKKALAEDEIPVGAVIVCKNQIIARAYNMTEKLNDVTAHAEMLAFTSASNYLNSKYLEDCTLYVTLEPCNMCIGAAFWTQIPRLVFGASDDKRGYTLTSVNMTHPKTKVFKGILADECSHIIREFFRKKRE